ncbi:MAG TPA: DinB family protein [Terriglobales bacterium]|nr:DinB family protein [Terriglobales bacterium]
MLAESTRQRLQSQLDSLPIILAGVDEAAIDRRPASGKWSARENLAHMARYQGVFLERAALILREDRPRITGYKAEADPEWPQWSALPLGKLRERLARDRAEIVALFAGLNATQLARSAAHSRFGEMTLVQWLEFFLLHEAHHLLAVLQRVRSAE